MPKKSPSTKKTASSKPTLKKAPAKKAAVKKVAKKKTASKKAAARKATPKTSAARKATSKKATNKGKNKKPQASDFLKRPSHTPAIFKPSVKKPIPILFTFEDVQAVLKKRAQEEKANKPGKRAAKKTTQSPAVPVVPVEESQQRKSKHAAASLDDILGLGGTSINPVPTPGKAPRKWQKYNKLLLELRDQVREELNMHSNDTLKRSQKEDAGDIAISVDAGTDNSDRDFALNLLSSEQEALNEIEAALKRIQNGTYGICEVTGEPINAERLEAVPFTRFSLEGQREHEATSRKRISQAGAFLNEASSDAVSFGDDDGDN